MVFFRIALSKRRGEKKKEKRKEKKKKKEKEKVVMLTLTNRQLQNRSLMAHSRDDLDIPLRRRAIRAWRACVSELSLIHI